MRSARLLKFATTALCFVAISAPTAVWGQDKDKKKDDGDPVECRIIYVPTPETVVKKMLDMAKVTKDDLVYDLGCGDGRICCMAARDYGAKSVGVDIDPARIKDCLESMKKYKVTKDQVDIRQGDALKVKDLERATVIMFYMLPEFMEKLEPQVLKRLKPGTRLVAHDFKFPNLIPDATVEFKGPEREHTLYMWTIKEKKE
ncbi:MAG: class I SAM-dependent methyltransferase [Planctomycetes bacterium]|nr:class I SAM-dependent methyltransferase [Planctomycetota bacterium]